MLASLFHRSHGAQRHVFTAFLQPGRILHSRNYGSPNTRNLYSNTAVHAAAGGRRTRSNTAPSTLDSWNYDNEFGAFDYVPDEYDVQDMNNAELLDDYEIANITSESQNPSWNNNEEIKEETAASNEEVVTSKKVEEVDEDLIETASAALQGKEETNEIIVTDRPSEAKRRPQIGTPASELDGLEYQLQNMRMQICDETNNPKFNPASPRQVAESLFGAGGGSTNKDVLEAMAARGNKMADQILQFRQLAREINKRRKRQESREKGTYAKSVYTVKRVHSSTLKNEKESNADEPMGERSKTGKEPEDLAVTFDRNDPLLLVDASAYIFRAYYAFPPLHRSDGMPIGAVLGFCNMLNRLVMTMMMEGNLPRIVLVFDAPGKTFRHGIYELYKANRPEAPVDLIPQFGLIREAAKAYGITQLEAPTYEADDVIATLATMALEEGIDCNILSGDKDLMQLVTRTDVSPSVQIIDPMSMSRVSYEDVIEKWGVAPELLGDVLALAGDSSDNVPGVPGIGPKIAADLLGSFGSLENLLENVEDVKQNARREKLKSNEEQARLSRVLVELERRVPMELMAFPEGTDTVAELRMASMDPDRLVNFFDEMGLRDLKRRFQNRLELQRGVKVTPQKRPRNSRFGPRPKAQIPTPEDFSDVPF